jgi:hypothetical protein
MKKIPLALLLLCLLMPLPAKTLGYGLGYYAQTVTQDVQETSSGIELSLAYEPFLFQFCNPSLVVATAVGSNLDGDSTFAYVHSFLSIDVFRTLSHPFSFATINLVAWDPSIGIGYQWVPSSKQHLLTLSASPLKLTQKDFWYEFFSPFISYDLSNGNVENWGFNLIRYTYFFR